MENIKVSLRFPKELVNEPIIYQLTKAFDIITNIRRAHISEEIGWMVLELKGEMDEIERAIDDLVKKGIKVDPIVGDIVEG